MNCKGCLCFVHPWCCPRLSFYVGDYFRVSGHELNVMGTDKEATYRTKYIFLKVGSRGVFYICVRVCVLCMCACVKKSPYFLGSRTKVSSKHLRPFYFTF